MVIPLRAGFTEKEFDDVKGILLDTNLPLLLLTVFISFFHVRTSFIFDVCFQISCEQLLFDFLAFKNDISFWRGRRSMVGLSTRTSEHISPLLLPSCSRLSSFRSKLSSPPVVWRCFSQSVVFLYLMDEKTSLLVIVPAGIAALIEVQYIQWWRTLLGRLSLLGRLY